MSGETLVFDGKKRAVVRLLKLLSPTPASEIAVNIDRQGVAATGLSATRSQMWMVSGTHQDVVNSTGVYDIGELPSDTYLIIERDAAESVKRLAGARNQDVIVKCYIDKDGNLICSTDADGGSVQIGRVVKGKPPKLVNDMQQLIRNALKEWPQLRLNVEGKELAKFLSMIDKLEAGNKHLVLVGSGLNSGLYVYYSDWMKKRETLQPYPYYVHVDAAPPSDAPAYHVYSLEKVLAVLPREALEETATVSFIIPPLSREGEVKPLFIRVQLLGGLEYTAVVAPEVDGTGPGRKTIERLLSAANAAAGSPPLNVVNFSTSAFELLQDVVSRYDPEKGFTAVLRVSGREVILCANDGRAFVDVVSFERGVENRIWSAEPVYIMFHSARLLRSAREQGVTSLTVVGDRVYAGPIEVGRLLRKEDAEDVALIKEVDETISLLRRAKDEAFDASAVVDAGSLLYTLEGIEKTRKSRKRDAEAGLKIDERGVALTYLELGAETPDTWNVSTLRAPRLKRPGEPVVAWLGWVSKWQPLIVPRRVKPDSLGNAAINVAKTKWGPAVTIRYSAPLRDGDEVVIHRVVNLDTLKAALKQSEETLKEEEVKVIEAPKEELAQPVAPVEEKKVEAPVKEEKPAAEKGAGGEAGESERASRRRKGAGWLEARAPVAVSGVKTIEIPAPLTKQWLFGSYTVMAVKDPAGSVQVWILEKTGRGGAVKRRERVRA